MPRKGKWAVLVLAAAALAGPSLGRAQAEASDKTPFTYYKLPNGLTVVLSTDNSSPIIAVGVYYQIGFRIEPRDRTGFAHLFEHMMFQGSQNLGKMQFIQLIQRMGASLTDRRGKLSRRGSGLWPLRG